jgi:hypothetical protein
MLYELPEDGTDVPKHVGAVKDHIFKYVSDLFVKVGFIIEYYAKCTEWIISQLAVQLNVAVPSYVKKKVHVEMRWR